MCVCVRTVVYTKAVRQRMQRNERHLCTIHFTLLCYHLCSASHQHRSHSYKVSCTHNARSEYITIWTHHTMQECSIHHVDGLCTKADSNGIHRAECRPGVTAQKEPKKLQTVACWLLASSTQEFTSSLDVLHLWNKCKSKMPCPSSQITTVILAQRLTAMAPTEQSARQAYEEPNNCRQLVIGLKRIDIPIVSNPSPNGVVETNTKYPRIPLDT